MTAKSPATRKPPLGRRDTEDIEAELAELAEEETLRRLHDQPTRRVAERMGVLSAELDRREAEYEAETVRMQAELCELVAERAGLMRRGYPPELAQMILELAVLRGVLYEQIGERLGVTKQAVLYVVQPLRRELGIGRDSALNPTWPRPFEDVKTPALLDQAAKLHARGPEPDPASPKVKATEEKIRRLADELRKRGQSVGAIAQNAGVGRTTLARIVGWDT